MVFSTCGTSETTVAHGEIVGGETLDGGEDLKPVEAGGGIEARLEDFRIVDSEEEGRSENAIVELSSLVSERETSDETVVSGDNNFFG
ncbi:hypothetical protein KIW84_010822 [Lathyrus oleraceus]|uniref:Uncharacterized protein n=1 Tax=Pisum sativum TaxID=3888 RepID=A0A9D5BBV0_PEA|nr:hypothetical protein KIW84_010822 [Pisum sativum]